MMTIVLRGGASLPFPPYIRKVLNTFNLTLNTFNLTLTQLVPNA